MHRRELIEQLIAWAVSLASVRPEIAEQMIQLATRLVFEKVEP